MDNHLKMVSLSFFILCMIIDKYIPTINRVPVVAFIHAVLVGIGSIFAIYMEPVDYFPDKTLECEPSPTILHTIIPAVSLGYSLFDLFDGIVRNRIDFLIHGISFTLCIGCMAMIDQQHMITRIMIIEISTIFYNLRKANWKKNNQSLIDVFFVILFFLGRLIIFPKWWMEWLFRYKEFMDNGNKMCIPVFVFYFSIIMGCVFHFLHIYWFTMIAKKVINNPFHGNNLKQI